MVTQVELHGDVVDKAEEAYQNVQRAERMVDIAERSLQGGRGTLLMATGAFSIGFPTDFRPFFDRFSTDFGRF